MSKTKRLIELIAKPREARELSALVNMNEGTVRARLCELIDAQIATRLRSAPKGTVGRGRPRTLYVLHPERRMPGAYDVLFG